MKWMCVCLYAEVAEVGAANLLPTGPEPAHIHPAYSQLASGV